MGRGRRRAGRGRRWVGSASRMGRKMRRMESWYATCGSASISTRSDRRFRGTATIFAGTVARDRSGNERGVRVVKRSGMFHRGFKPGMDAERFQNAWRVWAFRANFMYLPVL